MCAGSREDEEAEPRRRLHVAEEEAKLVLLAASELFEGDVVKDHLRQAQLLFEHLDVFLGWPDPALDQVCDVVFIAGRAHLGGQLKVVDALLLLLAADHIGEQAVPDTVAPLVDGESLSRVRGGAAGGALRSDGGIDLLLRYTLDTIVEHPGEIMGSLLGLPDARLVLSSGGDVRILLCDVVDTSGHGERAERG